MYQSLLVVIVASAFAFEQIIELLPQLIIAALVITATIATSTSQIDDFTWDFVNSIISN